MAKTEPKWAQQGMKMLLGTKFVKQYLTGALFGCLTYQEKLTNPFQGSEPVDEQKPAKKRIEQKAKDLEASFTGSLKIVTYFGKIKWMMMLMMLMFSSAIFVRMHEDLFLGIFPLLFVSQLSQANIEILSPFPSFPKKYFVLFCSYFCFVLCPMLTLRFRSPVNLSKNKYFPQSWTILHQRDKS